MGSKLLLSLYDGLNGLCGTAVSFINVNLSLLLVINDGSQ